MGNLMNPAEKMSTRELGLILAQQLLDVEDLHYGLWDDDLELSLSNLATAQQRYNNMLLEQVGRLVSGVTPATLLEVGCGTGHMLQLMLASGYRVDAINPSAQLNRLLRERLRNGGATMPLLLEAGFEAIPEDWFRNQYDLILFSESFQYIPLPELFEKMPRLLKKGGHVVICDFFKTAAHCDGEAGDRSFSGGHIESAFYRLVELSPFAIEYDEDLTPRVSPNIALIDDWLTHRLAPAAASVDTWFLDQHPRLTRLFKWLLRKKLARINYKYLSGHRSQAIFEKYKSYRLIVLAL